MRDYVEPFPRWYTPVKWFLPIAASIGVTALVSMAIAGTIAIPPALGTLAWLPAIYGSLTGAKAAAFIGLTSSAVGSLTFVASSIMVRVGLFSLNERIATQAQKAQERIDELLEMLSEKAGFNFAPDGNIFDLTQPLNFRPIQHAQAPKDPAPQQQDPAAGVGNGKPVEGITGEVLPSTFSVKPH